MGKRVLLAVVATISALLVGGAALADQVPASTQAMLLLRTLAYDHRLKERAGSTVTILVVYKPGNGDSEAAQKEITSALDAVSKKATVAGLPSKVVAIPFSTAQKFDADAKSSFAVAIYVCAGVEGSISEIARVARDRSMLSFTGTEAHVDGGVAIGLVTRGGKAAILINLKSAEAAGSDLDGALLRIAEVRK